MLKWSSVLALLASVLLSYSVVRSDDAAKKFQKLCPVSDKEAIDSASVAYKKGKVYFCCPNCPAAFEKEPKKFAVKANLQLAGTGQYKQAKCPLTGKPLNASTGVEVAGVKVVFCCNNCKAKVEGAKGDEQTALVFSDENFDKAFEPAKKKRGSTRNNANKEE